MQIYQRCYEEVGKGTSSVRSDKMAGNQGYCRRSEFGQENSKKNPNPRFRNEKSFCKDNSKKLK